VIGATGQQGGAVVRALRAGGQFKVRSLSRAPDTHRDLADEVVTKVWTLCEISGQGCAAPERAVVVVPDAAAPSTTPDPAGEKSSKE
jgi:uncharacterized protein YbjT (DUF2867 family)